MLGKYSKFLAPSSYKGREKVVSAFKDYFGTSDPQSTSPLMEARTANVAILGTEGMARMECVNGLAILVNTVPSAFWTIVQIYSNSQLLQRVRDLANAALTKEHVAGVKRSKINILKIQQSLEIQSIIQEVIRLRTTGIGPRLVREDVVLHEQYLLKKGSTVIIPNRAIHFDERTWGESVDIFDKNRFNKSSNKAKVPPVAYRGFGGGATICPGKHFAIEGIAVFTALFTLKYDLRPLQRDWSDLEQDMRDMSLQLGSPNGRFLVDVVPCKSVLDSEWCFEL